MADDSDIVLRWPIKNATATAALSETESEVFNERGFKWTAAVKRRPDHPNDKIDFILRCGVDHNGPWKCEAEVDVRVLQRDGSFDCNWVEKKRFLFDEFHSSWFEKSKNRYWSNFNYEGYNINNKFTVEFLIHIISSDKGVPLVDAATFSVPNSMSNVILMFGDQKLHVSKELLAIHSPVFEAMFFRDFAEKGKEEVEIKDVVYEEFLDLLQLIYLKSSKITDYTVPHLLKLADQFQMKDILNLAEDHLSNSKGFDVAKKLVLADQYRLVSLKDRCIQSFNSVADVTGKLNKSPEFANFSKDLKSDLFEKIIQLSLK